MGVLGWTPSEFWNATLWDLQAGLDGFAEKNSGKKKKAGDWREMKATLGSRIKA